MKGLKAGTHIHNPQPLKFGQSMITSYHWQPHVKHV